MRTRTRQLRSKRKSMVLQQLTMKAFLAVMLIFLISCTQQSVCEVVSFHNENAMNIILFPDGFAQDLQEELGEYVIASIKEKEPFASKPYFNIYLINNQDRDICKPVKPSRIYGTIGSPLPPLNCSIEEVAELATACGVERGKIIIMTEDNVASQTNIGFYESGIMFLDMKNQVPEIIQHEFGHFFGLVDERTRLVSFALGPGRQPGPNCAPAPGEARWKRFYPSNHTIAQGCAGHPEWYKPEMQTIMQTPDPAKGYGAFNEWYLGTAMDCCYAPNRTAYSCDAFFSEFPEWESCRE